MISEPVLVSTYSNTALPIIEETHYPDLHGCETMLAVARQSRVDLVAIKIDESHGCNKLCEEKAATKAQAAIRGFLVFALSNLQCLLSASRLHFYFS
jgi:hypothetical protein